MTDAGTPLSMGTPIAEFAIDEVFVSRLLADQHADLAHLPLRLVEAGWDNAMFRLGDHLAARLPRRAAAAALRGHEAKAACKSVQWTRLMPRRQSGRLKPCASCDPASARRGITRAFLSSRHSGQQPAPENLQGSSSSHRPKTERAMGSTLGMARRAWRRNWRGSTPFCGSQPSSVSTISVSTGSSISRWNCRP